MRLRTLFLIPSTNGLGHARRLIHLVKEWSEFNDILILLTPTQTNQLEEEIAQVLGVNYKVTILKYDGLGLDGYSHQSSPNHPISLDQDCTRKIMDAELVISDNCIWPLYLRPDTVLLGHFSWHDVLPLLSTTKQGIVREIFDLEDVLLKSAKHVIAIKSFTFGKFANYVNSGSILFPIYKTDSKKKPEIQEIWYSKGTTGLNSVEFSTMSSYKLLNRETYFLSNSESIPLGVIGRPGLGTIRDCIEFEVPFSPLYSGTDVELQHNVKVLERASLSETQLQVGVNSYIFHRFSKKSLIGATSFADFNARLNQN
jgi:hypothetical protein